ncbi:MAG TPA: hypothetical protein VKB77_02300 [Terriglobales bacterium]|nr:hypothetical protein [Terriglobales bacterium]
MRPWFVAMFLTVFSCVLVGQSTPSKPPAPRICVAGVANASTVSADLGRLADRLVAGLKRNKFDAVTMDSSTSMNHRLQPTRDNADEADAKQCDYTVLTRIVENRAHPAAPLTARPGAIVPSVDAADTMGGNSGPVYREEMEMDFALFRTSRADPLFDTSILERASAGVSDTFQSAMDRIASRVTHEIRKK